MVVACNARATQGHLTCLTQSAPLPLANQRFSERDASLSFSLSRSRSRSRSRSFSFSLSSSLSLSLRRHRRGNNKQRAGPFVCGRRGGGILCMREPLMWLRTDRKGEGGRALKPQHTTVHTRGETGIGNSERYPGETVATCSLVVGCWLCLPVERVKSHSFQPSARPSSPGWVRR